jgi:hypothetical protein
MIEKAGISFGPGSRNRLAETHDPSVRGAEAALESFYYALNNRDREVLREDWSAHPLAQLNTLSTPAGRSVTTRRPRRRPRRLKSAPADTFGTRRVAGGSTTTMAASTIPTLYVPTSERFAGKAAPRPDRVDRERGRSPVLEAGPNASPG